MTGDGLRFAVRGGEMAAAAALEALEHGWAGVHDRLAAARGREFGAKWRFNRALRAIVASPAAVRAAEQGARLAPALVRALIARAGDCDLATPDSGRPLRFLLDAARGACWPEAPTRRRRTSNAER
jgi:flavin-dependent dehydrogenase